MENEKENVIKTLIETEATLKKENKAVKMNKKRMKLIKNSKTWKIGKRLKRGQDQEPEASQLDQLKKKLYDTEMELYQVKDQLHKVMLDYPMLSGKDVVNIMREHRDNGTITDYLDDVIGQKKEHESNYSYSLHYAARLFMNEKQEYKNYIYEKILAGLRIEEIPEIIIRAGLTEENQASLHSISSYRAALNIRMRRKQLLGDLPEWKLDDKALAYEFADLIDVKRPWISEKRYSLEDIPTENGIVVKPVDGAGSRGVYLIHKEDHIIDLKRSNVITSMKELRDRMEDDLESKWVAYDEWLVEELVYEDREKLQPASDLKFYCFYGKVGLILEITRVPEVNYCWWTATGERVRTGKYNDQLFKGNGAQPAEIDLASKISAMIPAPFIRIDFLRSEEGLVFGEFTPKPGNYDEFNEPTDQWLGDMFIEAQGRLDRDLLEGKAFEEFKQFTNKL